MGYLHAHFLRVELKPICGIRRKGDVRSDDGRSLRTGFKSGQDFHASPNFFRRFPQEGKIIFEPPGEQPERAGSSGNQGVVEFFRDGTGSYDLAASEPAQEQIHFIFRDQLFR